jgi:hypothetical protein
MPAMHGAIQAVISLYALGLMSGNGMVTSNRASHTVPYSIGVLRGSLLLSLVLRTLRLTAQRTLGMPARYVTIQAGSSLCAFGFTPDIDLDCSDEASRTASTCDWWSSRMLWRGSDMLVASATQSSTSAHVSHRTRLTLPMLLNTWQLCWRLRSYICDKRG